MTAWLLKTEPSAYSFDHLVASKVDSWDGVTNTTAQKYLRSAQIGERCLIYHTGNERRVMGLARVVRAAYPDPYANNSKLVAIDVEAGPRLPTPVSLEQLKVEPLFADSPLLRQSRLSVVPLTNEQFEVILRLAKLDS